MTLLTLEINDTGIMAAVGRPAQLLPVDGDALQSPGFAVVERKQVLVGRAARDRAHLAPRFTFDAFWDRLQTDPLPQRLPRARSHAEMAYLHLAQIWQQVRPGVDEVVMAVPPHFDRHAMGIIVSIARELSMPLRGFTSLAVAAADRVPDGGCLLHMDLHLHRLEITRLEVDDRICLQDSRWLEEKGLVLLQRRWAEALASEFVQTTRFDPLHRAVTEQELYDRLPGLLAEVRRHGSAAFEIGSGQGVHRITVTGDLLAEAVDGVLSEVPHLIRQMSPDAPPAVQYTHRLAVVPGFENLLAAMGDALPLPLPPGAAARGTAGMWQELEESRSDARALYFTSRPRRGLPTLAPEKNGAAAAAAPPPATHVLLEDTAYPLSAAPLVIGSRPPAGGLRLAEHDAVRPRHCSLRLEAGEVLLEVHEDAETLLDGRRVRGRRRLSRGQVLQIGNPGVRLRLITCLGTPDGT